jgi:hypothetical protein
MDEQRPSDKRGRGQTFGTRLRRPVAALAITALAAGSGAIMTVGTASAGPSPTLSQATAQALDLNLAGLSNTSLGIDPGIQAVNNGSQLKVAPTPTGLNLGGVTGPLGLQGLTLGLLSEAAQATNDGKSSSSSGLVAQPGDPNGLSLDLDDLLTTAGSGVLTLGGILGPSGLPGVGGVLAGLTGDLSNTVDLQVELNAVSASASENGTATPSLSSSITGGNIALTLLGTTVNVPLTINSATVGTNLVPEVVSAILGDSGIVTPLANQLSTTLTSLASSLPIPLSTILNGLLTGLLGTVADVGSVVISPLLTSLTNTLSTTLAPAVALQTNVQAANSVTALHVGILSGAVGSVNVATATAGPNLAPGAPTILPISSGGIVPDSGPTAGGTLVTITGTGFQTGATVGFGGNAATSVDVVSPTKITADSPAGAAGVAQVIVTDPVGDPSNSEPFTYVPPTPTINSTNGITPDSGPTAGGTPVTIDGTGYLPGATVAFGPNQATNVDVISPTVITASSPPGTVGGTPVTVTDLGGTSGPQTFTYTASNTPPPPTPAPVVTGITPSSGAPAGGNPVEVVGTNLCGVISVTFGGTPATNVTVNAACTIVTVDAPPGTGTVPVVITTSGGSATSPVDYTYTPPGYWETASDGGVFAFGGAKFYGSTGNIKLNMPIVAMADTPDHKGYWLFAKDGGVFAFGDAPFLGSVPGVLNPGQFLNGPIVAAEATPDGKGYRMFASDGGVFDFGDAQFTGSLPGIGVTPNKPVVAAVSTPVGQGYLLVAGDGGVFTFGNGTFQGSLGASASSGIVSISETTSGNGYWVFGANGSVTPFGGATDFGNAVGVLSAPVIFGAATTTDLGYWMFGTDGGVYARGDAPFLGSLAGTPLNLPIVGGIGF